jgi:hypothetical protein
VNKLTINELSEPPCLKVSNLSFQKWPDLYKRKERKKEREKERKKERKEGRKERRKEGRKEIKERNKPVT